MSIKVMNWVWEHATVKGGDLLVLLAIADFADDDGRAYPSVTRLAEKARLSERAAQYSIRKLASMGLLTVEAQKGRAHTNLYRVACGTDPGKGAKSAPVQNLHPLKGAICDTEKVQWAAPDPSLDPSVLNTTYLGQPSLLPIPAARPSRSVKKPTIPPHTAIFDAYLQARQIDYRTLPQSTKNRLLGEAKQLAEAGWAPEQVTGCIAALSSDPYLAGQLHNLRVVIDRIADWSKNGLPRKQAVGDRIARPMASAYQPFDREGV